jgi:hypothetical protein
MINGLRRWLVGILDTDCDDFNDNGFVHRLAQIFEDDLTTYSNGKEL